MFSLAAALPVGGLARACGGAGAWPCLGDRVPAAEPVAADAGGHCAVHDDGARCAKSEGGARARLVVRPRAFHAWAELDRHILSLSGGDAGLARLGGGAASVAVLRPLSGRGTGVGLVVRPR